MSRFPIRLDLTGKLIESVDFCNGFITGSSVIGGFNEESNIDVVFSLDRGEDVREVLSKKCGDFGFSMMDSDYNKGYKFVNPGCVSLNVVTLHPYDYCAWLFATNTLKEQHPIHDKYNRHRAFELAVTLFKLANVGTDYLTVDGARKYYQINHAFTLSKEFETVSTRLETFCGPKLI